MAFPIVSLNYGIPPDNCTLTIKQAEGSALLTATDSQVIELAKRIHAFHLLVTLRKFDFFLDADLGPSKFRFKIEQNGRKWNQILTIAQPDLTIKDLGSDEWLLSEFNYIRAIREVIVPLVLHHGLIDITGRW